MTHLRTYHNYFLLSVFIVFGIVCMMASGQYIDSQASLFHSYKDGRKVPTYSTWWMSKDQTIGLMEFPTYVFSTGTADISNTFQYP
jgi:hypothetical protein